MPVVFQKEFAAVTTQADISLLEQTSWITQEMPSME